MRHIYSLTAAALLAAATATGAVLTANNQESKILLPDGMKVQTTMSGDLTESIQPAEAAPRKAAATAKVTVKVKYDTASVDLNGKASLTLGATICRAENSSYGTVSKADPTVVTFDTVATGVPCFMNVRLAVDDNAYSLKHYGGSNLLIYLTKEFVLTGDTTINVDMADCKNRITFNKVLPDGTAPVVDTTWVEGSTTTYGTRTNVLQQSYQRGFYWKKRPNYFYLLQNNARQLGVTAYVGTDITTDFSHIMDFYVNDVSSDYTFYGVYRAILNDGNYTPVIITYDIKDGVTGNLTLTNDKAGFATHYETLGTTPRGRYSAMRSPGISHTILKNHFSQLGARLSLNYDLGLKGDTTWTEKIQYAQVATPGDGESGMGLYINGILNDFVKVTKTSTRTSYTYNYLQGPTFEFTDAGEARYINYGAPGNHRNDTTLDDYNLNTYAPYTFIADEDNPVVSGSNAPITELVQTCTKNTYGKKFAYVLNSIGMLGEVRNLDNDSMQVLITYNDSVICNQYSKMSSALSTLNKSKLPDGVIHSKFINNNILIDGKQGQNVTELEFDMRKDDWEAPALTFLRLTDAQGKVTNKINVNAEGNVEISAADFDNLDSKTSYFVIKPLKIEVSYAPTGTDSWSALQVTEDASKFRYPAFGYYYKGSVKGLKVGWYDLKVKLTDEAGNWQEQTLKRAFGINNVTSVTEVKTASNRKVVARYAIDGRQLREAEPGVNIVRYSDGTAEKVIVR